MKVWFHIIAAVVGLCVAALIVWFVFGTASEQGAVQEGSAGALAAADNLCGTIDVADLTSPETRALARDNQPSLFDAKGPIPAISKDFPQQQAWVDRVHAASGLCIDELHIERSGTSNNVVTIDMSTVDSTSEAVAAAYAMAAIDQAFAAPFSPIRVDLSATVGGEERTISVSRRAWRAFQARRRQLQLPATVENLRLFRQAAGGALRGQLVVTGW